MMKAPESVELSERKDTNNWKIVLEIGVYAGFSALVWADAVGPNGFVTGLEFEPEYAELSKKAFKENNINNVEIIVGPASESWVVRRCTLHHNVLTFD